MSLYTFVNGRKEYIIRPNLFKLTIIPTPSDATVILQSTGFVQHGNYISVPAGATVNYTLTKAGYEKTTGSIIMSNYERTVSLSMSVIQETLLKKYTSGSFEYTIPEQYNYARFIIAGACGGRNWQSDGAGIYAEESPGKGAVIEKTITLISSNRVVTGVVGVRPTMSYGSEHLGGVGYSAGENSVTKSVTVEFISGGGGGGSSAVVINGVIYEACGGGGRSGLIQLGANCYGGKGGGVYGGARKTSDYSNGNDATNPDAVGYNSGSGYIEIYAGYR